MAKRNIELVRKYADNDLVDMLYGAVAEVRRNTAKGHHFSNDPDLLEEIELYEKELDRRGVNLYAQA